MWSTGGFVAMRQRSLLVKKVFLPATALALLMSGPPVLVLWTLKVMNALDPSTLLIWAAFSLTWSTSVALAYLRRSRLRSSGLR